MRALAPQPIFQYFEQLAQLPRPSKHEGRVLSWLREFAHSRQLKVAQDTKGNLVIYKPGQAGGEAAPPVILQGHVDMVCEANSGSAHDFTSDPISLVVEGDWLKAAGTTLGADNGVGVAAILAVLDMDASVPCPPIEALFTVEEEIGLVGASALDASMLSGKTLLNLDSEDWGIIFMGCAGAGESALTLSVDLEPLGQRDETALVPMVLSVSGLAGGHSGLQISQGLGNAVQMMAGALEALVLTVPGTRLVQLRGGDKRNAIPREATADVLLPKDQLAAAKEAMASRLAQMREVYGSVEPELLLQLVEAALPQLPDAVVTNQGVHDLIGLLIALPHGPVRLSPAMEGLVETSNNVASIKPGIASDGKASYSIIVTTRSSFPAALAVERRRIAALARMAGAKVEQPADYAGWAPNPSSPLLAMTKDAVRKVYGREPRVTAIHAGLECGVLGSVLGGDVDMVSFGPTILGAHSPSERLEVSTVQPFWEATLMLLAELAKKR